MDKKINIRIGVNCNCQSDTWGILGYNVFGYTGESIGTMSFLMILFNKFVWKWKWIKRFVDMPVLAKNYTGTLILGWQKENKEYDANLEVKQ